MELFVPVKGTKNMIGIDMRVGCEGVKVTYADTLLGIIILYLLKYTFYLFKHDTHANIK